MEIKLSDTQFPTATLMLQSGETARIQRSSMIYHSVSVELSASLNGRGHGLGKLMSTLGRKITSGESSLITTATARDNGFIAIAPNAPGDISILECDRNHQYNIDDGKFLAMSEGCDYKMYRQNIVKGMLSGNGGMFVMQTSGIGQVLVNSFGSIQRLHLENNAITIDNDHVVAWDSNLDYDIHTENGFFKSIGTGEGLVDTFTGTGDVLIQTLNLPNFAEQLLPYLSTSN